MPRIELSIQDRKAHRAEAHHLEPVVLVGNDGLTPAVKKEVDAALTAHGLIKVRVFGDDRLQREQVFDTLADDLGAAQIQHIGKLLALRRPKGKKERAAEEDRKPGPREYKVMEYDKRGGQRPNVKTLRVLGNQRLTSGGKVKKAKPKQRSVKKTAR